MGDTDTIQTAYADTLIQLFSVYFDSLSSADGDAATEATALAAFRQGVTLARRARDKAVVVVQQAAQPDLRT
ncbi:MAG TPA: hypothetical protein VF292_01495 [Rhodanobacteraceae bacterium]